MAQPLTKKQLAEWSARNHQAFGGLLTANSFAPVTGDIQSGLLAANDLRNGNYGDAALNGIGLLPFVPSMAGMFIGKGSNAWDAVKAAQAEEMLKAGKTPEQIWPETATWVNPPETSGMPIEKAKAYWRQEIPDNNAIVDMSQVSKKFPGNDGVTMGSGNARDMLDHPTLWNQYTDYSTDAGNIGGYATHLVHDPKFNAIEGDFRPSSRTFNMKADSQEGLASGLLHEVQHAIQRAEGWATGGNTFNAPLAVTEAKNEALRPLSSSNYAYQDLSSKAGELSQINYLKKLETLSKKENIKPSDITNMSPWYEYSDDIRSWLGPMPKQAGANRDNWLRQAADRMLLREKAKVELPEFKLNEYMARDAKDLKNEYAKIDRQRNKYLNDAKKYSETERKFKEIGGMSEYEQYRRIAGEAEARATQARMNMTMPERLKVFPFDSYDVPKDQLIVRGLLGR